MQRSPEEIAKAASIWIKYGVISPITFCILAILAHHYEIITSNTILVIGAVIALITCFVWWFWALKVIVDLSSLNSITKNALTDIKEYVIIMSQEVKEQRSLYDILKKEIAEEKKRNKKK